MDSRSGTPPPNPHPSPGILSLHGEIALALDNQHRKTHGDMPLHEVAGLHVQRFPLMNQIASICSPGVPNLEHTMRAFIDLHREMPMRHRKWFNTVIPAVCAEISEGHYTRMVKLRDEFDQSPEEAIQREVDDHRYMQDSLKAALLPGYRKVGGLRRFSQKLLERPKEPLPQYVVDAIQEIMEVLREMDKEYERRRG